MICQKPLELYQGNSLVNLKKSAVFLEENNFSYCTKDEVQEEIDRLKENNGSSTTKAVFYD